MPNRMGIKRFGWLPAPKDNRDYSPEKLLDSIKEDDIKAKFKKISRIGSAPKTTKTKIDNSASFTPIKDQQDLGSCTAFGANAMTEMLIKKALGKSFSLSELFTYKMTRHMMGWTGDTGAYCRSAMGSLRMFGTPETHYWPYYPINYEKMPPWDVGALADDYQAITYFRLDYPNLPTREDIVNRINMYIAKGFPVIIGFNCYDSLLLANETGEIPYPAPNEDIIGGHCVAIAGYDLNKEIKNSINGSITKGAWMIKNSWGKTWGKEGYGWIPFAYYLNGDMPIADDFWTLTKTEWVNADVFGE